jgi:hypothetical protein
LALVIDIGLSSGSEEKMLLAMLSTPRSSGKGKARKAVRAFLPTAASVGPRRVKGLDYLHDAVRSEAGVSFLRRNSRLDGDRQSAIEWTGWPRGRTS